MLSNKVNNRIIVALSDKAISLIYLKDNHLQDVLYIDNTELLPDTAIYNKFGDDEELQISIYIDSKEQLYSLHDFSSPGIFSNKNIAAQILKDKAPMTDFKYSLYIDRLKNNKFQYLFAYSPNNEFIQKWCNFFYQSSHIVEGVYLLSTELAMTIKNMVADSIFNVFLDQDKWYILATPSSIGIRVSLYRKKIIYSTQIVNIEENEIPEIIAGNIEQACNNIIHEITLKGEKNYRFYTTIICNDETRQYIRKDKINTEGLIITTISDIICNKNNMKSVYVDHALLYMLANTKKHVYKITLNQFKYSNVFVSLVKKIKILTKLFVPIGLISIIIIIFNIFSLQEKLYINNKKNIIINNKITQIKAQSPIIQNNEDIVRITDVANIHIFLTNNYVNPLHDIAEIFQIEENKAKVKHIKWHYANPRLILNADPIAFQGRYKITKAHFDIILKNNGNSFGDLQKSYIYFAEKLQYAFINSTLEISDLPAKVAFYKNFEQVELDVKLTHDLNMERK